MSAVRANFSTWDVPDAAFDGPSNTLYAVARLRPPHGEALGIVGYDRTGAVVSALAALDPAMKPDNLGAPHMDRNAKRRSGHGAKERNDGASPTLNMQFGPYNQSTQTWSQGYVEVDAVTGATLRTVAVDARVVTGSFEMVSGSDAFDAATRTVHQFYENEDLGPGQVLASMSLDTGALKITKTQVESGDFCIDPVFHGGRIYCFNGNGFLIAVDVHSGEVEVLSKVRRWRRCSPPLPLSPPLLAMHRTSYPTRRWLTDSPSPLSTPPSLPRCTAACCRTARSR